jgi:hypothetical protein
VWWATLAFFSSLAGLKAMSRFPPSRRRGLAAALAVLAIAAGAAVGFIAGKPRSGGALQRLAAGTQTVRRGALQTAVPVPGLKAAP